MELRFDAHIAFPRDLVFATYRDKIADLLPYLPNVRRIDVKSRKEEGPIAELVNEWHGGGEIPAAVRAVLGDSILAWTDYATWNADTRRCDWRNETHAFVDALRCAGSNAFIEDGPEKTIFQVRGTLAVDARKIRGVPGFIAGKVGRTIEDFLGNKIQLNLGETTKGLARYLEERRQVPLT